MIQYYIHIVCVDAGWYEMMQDDIVGAYSQRWGCKLGNERREREREKEQLNKR